ncbi:MAG: hypothetical protein R6V12_13285, partial [Candidatus Hydrogenedentota bacterium]
MFSNVAPAVFNGSQQEKGDAQQSLILHWVPLQMCADVLRSSSGTVGQTGMAETGETNGSSEPLAGGSVPALEAAGDDDIIRDQREVF